MKIKFWGTRGGVPTPEPECLKYGGNTPCIEVRLSSGELIIIDAGTGIRRLGISLLNDPYFNKKAHLFISHCHWDHIQGFPFFQPAFIPGYEFTIYGQFKLDGRLEDLIRGQMEYLYFPVTLDKMASKIKFVELIEETLQVGDVKITSRHLNHPQGNMGFRIESGEGIFTYCSDTEHSPDKYDKKVLELADKADIFVYDCQYTEEEYKTHIGWGHSTWKAGTELSKEAGAKKLVIFHHDATHDDQTIDLIVNMAQERFPNTIAASRDMELTLESNSEEVGTRKIKQSLKKKSEKYEINRIEDKLYVTASSTLEVFNSEKFISDVLQQIDGAVKEVIFNFSELKEIDSVSLGTLARFHEKAKNFGIRFILTNVNEFIKEVLTITRFTQVIEIQN